MPMQSSPFPTTTLMLLVCSLLAGSLVLLPVHYGQVTGHIAIVRVNFSSHLTGHLSCFSDC